jgi:hypothetical protein
MFEKPDPFVGLRRKIVRLLRHLSFPDAECNLIGLLNAIHMRANDIDAVASARDLARILNAMADDIETNGSLH